MKTYIQLTNDEQKAAIEKCVTNILKVILEGGGSHFFEDYDNSTLKFRIDKAIATADEMRVPWFASEYIMDTCRDDINQIAEADAKDSLYSEPGEVVIAGIA